MGLHEYMKNLKQHILEKLKVSTNNKPSGIFKPSEECDVLWNDFIDALEKHGEFNLSEIFGDNLPLWDSRPEKSKIVSIYYYEEEDYIIARLITNENVKYEHYIENMRSLKFRLGNQDILVGNTVVTEIYDLIR